MRCSIIDIPQELLQRIALFAELASPLGPPKELYNCLLTCRQFRDFLSPRCAGELYTVIFSQKFDARAPTYRLSAAGVRENAPFELRRRFSALKIFKSLAVDDHALTEALWIAYLMVEDTDTSQKNVKQLLRASLPSFLDFYLRRRLYEGAENNNGWPVLNEQNSLVVALSWTLASQSSINREDRMVLDEMRDLLRPLVFASFRYSLFHTPEDSFGFGNTSSKNYKPPYPLSILPAREIVYFGNVTRKARPPSAALFAVLLYFVRTESITPFVAPKHITCKTRQDATATGYEGLCLEDFEHFYRHCRTRFADFPALDVGIQSSAVMSSSDTVLCQPSAYKLGTLSGMWQGSQLIPFVEQHEQWTSSSAMPKEFGYECRTPVYLTIEEHYCSDGREVVPKDHVESGMKNAWLPNGLLATPTKDGMSFTDADGSFHTTYTTYQRGKEPSPEKGPVVDVIITGKTDDQYARWGGGTVVLGRVRLHDGLMVFVKSLPDDTDDGAVRQIFRGYVTSSRNLVGRVKGAWNSSESYYEGVFSLGKNYNMDRPC